MKWWIQSFLLGVPKIVAGFRSRDGVLLRVEELDVAGLPDVAARNPRRRWDGNICINFASEFLACEYPTSPCLMAHLSGA